MNGKSSVMQLASPPPGVFLHCFDVTLFPLDRKAVVTKDNYGLCLLYVCLFACKVMCDIWSHENLGGIMIKPLTLLDR